MNLSDWKQAAQRSAATEKLQLVIAQRSAALHSAAQRMCERALMVERAEKFENNYIGVHRWWFDVLVCLIVQIITGFRKKTVFFILKKSNLGGFGGFYWFLACDSMLSALYAIANPSVRLSVCPSHGWSSRKRLKLGSCNFHRTLAPFL